MRLPAGRRVRTIALALGCLTLGGLAVPGGTALAAQITQVFVTNDDAHPVPVKAIGTTQVGGTVAISGQPSVTVANGAGAPVATREVGGRDQAVYQKTIYINQTSSICTSFVCTVTFDRVPAGYRLVVSYASAQFKLSQGGQEPQVEVGSSGSDAAVSLPIPQPLGFDKYLAAGPLTYYVAAGAQPTIQYEGQFVSNDGSNTSAASLVGYLVPA